MPLFAQANIDIVNVKSEGIGQTLNEAVDDALVQAISMVNGKSIESETLLKTKSQSKSTNEGSEFSNEKEMQDEIKSRTNGIVDGYKILNQSKTQSGNVKVKLEVKIAKFKLPKSAKRKKAKGFIGTSIDATSHYFQSNKALGTMPHALIGYAGSTLEAVKMFHETFPKDDLVVLPDYFGKEITDSIQVCSHFDKLSKAGKVMIRLDTPNGRFIENLDTSKSYEVLEKHAPGSIKEYRSDKELKHLVGPGVSAASLWYLRAQLDNFGFKKVKIIASSGFTNEKCKAMSLAKAPIDVIGTGSYLPEKWSETYATADIIKYGNSSRVKVSREYLLKKVK